MSKHAADNVDPTEELVKKRLETDPLFRDLVQIVQLYQAGLQQQNLAFTQLCELISNRSDSVVNETTQAQGE